ncbi:hypothetical protein SteCoe_1062 [Stentor coeruleus]|uniref:Uncharacterized protein n=1 Tax=Stentor coeruleus TaxID=5963 RepID=A0A1R2D2L6_9CILI|nr:hypothetical protein SteCoe_1062 [Stentor coeruleus]
MGTCTTKLDDSTLKQNNIKNGIVEDPNKSPRHIIKADVNLKESPTVLFKKQEKKEDKPEPKIENAESKAKTSSSLDELADFPDFHYFNRNTGQLFQITKSLTSEILLKSDFHLAQESAIAYYEQNNIISIGGTFKSKIVSTVSIINISLKKAYLIASLPKPCKQGQAHEYKGWIYYVGGMCESENGLIQSPLMRYNIQQDIWQDLGRYGEYYKFNRIINMGTCIMGDKLLLIGGQRITSKNNLSGNKKIYSISLEKGFKIQIEGKMPNKLLKPSIAAGSKHGVIAGGISLTSGALNKRSYCIINKNDSFKIMEIDSLDFDLVELYPAFYFGKFVMFISFPYVAVRIKKITHWLGYKITGKTTRLFLQLPKINAENHESESSDESERIEDASKRSIGEISLKSFVEQKSDMNSISISDRKSLNIKTDVVVDKRLEENKNLEFSGKIGISDEEFRSGIKGKVLENKIDVQMKLSNEEGKRKDQGNKVVNGEGKKKMSGSKLKSSNSRSSSSSEGDSGSSMEIVMQKGGREMTEKENSLEISNPILNSSPRVEGPSMKINKPKIKTGLNASIPAPKIENPNTNTKPLNEDSLKITHHTEIPKIKTSSPHLESSQATSTPSKLENSPLQIPTPSIIHSPIPPNGILLNPIVPPNLSKKTSEELEREKHNFIPPMIEAKISPPKFIIEDTEDIDVQVKTISAPLPPPLPKTPDIKIIGKPTTEIPVEVKPSNLSPQLNFKNPPIPQINIEKEHNPNTGKGNLYKPPSPSAVPKMKIPEASKNNNRKGKQNHKKSGSSDSKSHSDSNSLEVNVIRKNDSKNQPNTYSYKYEKYVSSSKSSSSSDSSNSSNSRKHGFNKLPNSEIPTSSKNTIKNLTPKNKTNDKSSGSEKQFSEGNVEFNSVFMFRNNPDKVSGPLFKFSNKTGEGNDEDKNQRSDFNAPKVWLNAKTHEDEVKTPDVNKNLKVLAENKSQLDGKIHKNEDKGLVINTNLKISDGDSKKVKEKSPKNEIKGPNASGKLLSSQGKTDLKMPQTEIKTPVISKKIQGPESEPNKISAKEISLKSKSPLVYNHKDIGLLSNSSRSSSSSNSSSSSKSSKKLKNFSQPKTLSQPHNQISFGISADDPSANLSYNLNATPPGFSVPVFQVDTSLTPIQSNPSPPSLKSSVKPLKDEKSFHPSPITKLAIDKLKPSTEDNQIAFSDPMGASESQKDLKKGILIDKGQRRSPSKSKVKFEISSAQTMRNNPHFNLNSPTSPDERFASTPQTKRKSSKAKKLSKVTFKPMQPIVVSKHFRASVNLLKVVSTYPQETSEKPQETPLKLQESKSQPNHHPKLHLKNLIQTSNSIPLISKK